MLSKIRILFLITSIIFCGSIIFAGEIKDIPFMEAEESITNLKKENERFIYIIGEVKTPGLFVIDRNIKLTHAISLAGGFKDSAKLSKINILRGNPEARDKMVINMNKIIGSRSRQKDIKIFDDDIIYVPNTIYSEKWIVSKVVPVLTMTALLLVLL